MAEGEYPNEYLQDFWKTLWHVDVYKDQKHLYDQKVVNSYLLDDGKYMKTQPIESTLSDYSLKGQLISKKDTIAGRKGGGDNVLGFDNLFKYLTGKEFGELTKQKPGFEANSILNPTIMGDGIKYQIKVFDDKGNIGTENKLPEFIGNNIALFVDTTSHLSELLENYKKSGKDIIYAYTREIESDPADKTTYLTIGKGNQTDFYYELPPPVNPEIVEYPQFTKKDGLSYFYCKYPIYLKYFGIKEDKKKTLKVELSYKKGDKVVTIPEGANVAGAFSKVQSSVKSILGFKDNSEKLEMCFISKHHGDVAQSLVKFRDVKMECPSTDASINTADYQAVFVSIDCNAIIKALTIGVPFIFMYPPDKKSIIVWKNESLNDPKLQYESEKAYTLEQNKRFLDKQKKYNETIEEIKKNTINLNSVIADKLSIDISKDEIEGMTLDNIANKYKDYLKLGITISTLIKYVPKPTEDITSLDNPGFESEIDTIDKSEDEFSVKLSKLKDIQMKISARDSDFKIPVEYTTIKLVDGNELKTVSFENDVHMKFTEVPKSKKGSQKSEAERKEEETTKGFAKVRAGKDYSFKQGDRRIENMWETTNLIYNYGDFSIESLICRFGTKLNNSWAFDIINYIYNNIESYNVDYAKNIIDRLYKIVLYIPESIQTKGKPKKIDTFRFGMDLLGLRELLPPVTTGGNRKLRRGGVITSGPTQVMYETPTDKKVEVSPLPVTVEEPVEPREEDDIVLDAINIELSDMYTHLKFMNTMLFLDKYRDNLSKNDLERYGLQAFNSFFQKVFSGQGENDNKYYVDTTEFTRRSRLVTNPQIGGAETFTLFDDSTIKGIIAMSKKGTIELSEIEVFDDKAPFYTTMFSPILFYEYILSIDISKNIEAEKTKSQGIQSRLVSLRGKIGTRSPIRFGFKSKNTAYRNPEKIQKRIEEAEETIKKIEDIIKIINESNQDEWTKEYSQTTGNQSAGGRRLRKFKTYKKSRTNKKKTLKRFK